MFSVNETSERVTFVFTGRQDSKVCAEIMEPVRQKTTETEKAIVFDLQGVDYVSSAFLRICLQTAKTVGVERFSVVNVTPPIKVVFKLSGFDQMLKIS